MTTRDARGDVGTTNPPPNGFTPGEAVPARGAAGSGHKPSWAEMTGLMAAAIALNVLFIVGHAWAADQGVPDPLALWLQAILTPAGWAAMFFYYLRVHVPTERAAQNAFTKALLDQCATERAGEAKQRADEMREREKLRGDEMRERDAHYLKSVEILFTHLSNLGHRPPG